jgi:hypothetical protein
VIGVPANGEGRRPSSLDMAVAGCLAVAIVLGSALMWIGVPVAGFWVAARITGEGVRAVLFALLAIPLTMAAFGWLLYRASARYEALRGGAAGRRGPPAWRVSLGEERASERRRAGGRQLIEVAMTVWFFFFAELRLSPFP